MLFFTSISHALDWKCVATNSGNWSNPLIWTNGQIPTGTNYVKIANGVTINVDTINPPYATCQWLDLVTAGGTAGIKMATNATLIVTSTNLIGEGYASMYITVDANASNNTVIYQGNSFWARHTNYWNLVFAGWGDFYNGAAIAEWPNNPIWMTIKGNFTVTGTNIAPEKIGSYSGCYVQCGSDMTVLGDLIIGESNAWDCSDSITDVKGNTYCAGILSDKDGVNGSNIFEGNVTILPSKWWLTNQNDALLLKVYLNDTNNFITNGLYGGTLYTQDSPQWAFGANLTNNGIITIGVTTNYGTLNFNGTGNIAGSNVITSSAMTVNGNYRLNNTIILRTNAPTINGTLVVDICTTNQIVLDAGTNWFWYTTNGTLVVTNSCGSAPGVGSKYTFFVTNGVAGGGYSGGYSTNIFPSLNAGLYWINELLTNGSIVVGNNPPLPFPIIVRSNDSVIVTWPSGSFPGSQLLTLTNSAGIITNSTHTWTATGSNTSPAIFKINTNTPTFFRLGM